MQATVLGLLYVVAAEDSLGREELEFLTAFAGIVAVTMENLWLMERARGEAVSQAAYQRHFAPFVAEQIAGQSGGHDGAVGLEGARRRVAFLCCELRGFAELAEELQPQETARLLSEFFGEMANVVFEHGGTLDRLTGAGLTALWGAPLSRQDDADEAVQAAIGIQRELERLNGEWSRQGRRNLAVAINVSVRNLYDSEFADHVAARLQHWGLPASSLHLEITEGMLMADPVRAEPVLARLHEMGVVLGQTAFSPNIKERHDFSCAIFDARGELVAQAAHIPVHLGSTPLSVRAAIANLDLGLAARDRDELAFEHQFRVTVAQPGVDAATHRGGPLLGATNRPLCAG